MLVTPLERAKAPLNDTRKDWKLTRDFVMDLTFWLARGFDFVFPLGVTTPLVTPVMSFDWIGSFWEIDFDMLKSMGFGNLAGLLSSSRWFDRVYQGWFVLKKKLLEEHVSFNFNVHGPCGRIMLKITYLGSQYLQCHLTYFLFVLQQHIMFFLLLVIYCGGIYLKSPPASYVKRSIVH